MSHEVSVTEPLAVDTRTAARLLSISVRYLRQLVRRGEIPSLRLGRRRLFRVEDLRRWLEAHSAHDR